MQKIGEEGCGLLIYLRQEGRGIGLVNKLKAYSLQDMGLDTVEANEKLGLPVDQRNYGVGAQILNDIGVKQFCLITNNPRKIAGLKGYGLDMVNRVPLIIEATAYNSGYLATKAHKLGHLLMHTYLVTVAIHWRTEDLPLQDRYQKLEHLRGLAQSLGLVLQEEARPVAAALFSQPDLIVNLGLESRPEAGSETWYRDRQDSRLTAIATLLDKLATWSDIDQLAFLLSGGSDPFSGLQVGLNRQVFHRDAEPTSETVKPSDLCNSLESQRIYVFSSHIPMD
jgi:3,4-dihydroxy 2-butanone 4-phosphate synthase / GTP cyclohydrolase II